MGNGLPDRIRLHRRVLLIRPDLNMAAGTLPSYTPPDGTVSYLQADNWGTDTTSGTPAIKTPGTNGINIAQTANAWLIGMAPVHQQCDLSVRRVIGANGLPTATIAANSLADLSKPENRFAHVRMPGTYIDADHAKKRPFTTMPLLALGGRTTILDPTSPVSNTAVPPNTGAFVINPPLMNGFLRPEFVLGQDFTHTEFIGDAWGVERLGEDVMATDILGFDVKGFDINVRTFMTKGPDGGFGIAGTDDDGIKGEDNVEEAGLTGTDDVLITPSDAAMREVLVGYNSDLSKSVATMARSGAFVDLFYPFLAGGTIRGPAAVDYRNGIGNPVAIPDLYQRSGNFRDLLQSNLSGLTNNYVLPSNTLSLYTEALYKSGRLITTTGRMPVLVQPAFDTFTNEYERDGFLQSFPSFNGGSGYGTVWYANDADGEAIAGYANADVGANGLDDGGFLGIDDLREQETSAPFIRPLPAIKVTVRIENPTTRQLEQMSAMQDF